MGDGIAFGECGSDFLGGFEGGEEGWRDLCFACDADVEFSIVSRLFDESGWKEGVDEGGDIISFDECNGFVDLLSEMGRRAGGICGGDGGLSGEGGRSSELGSSGAGLVEGVVWGRRSAQQGRNG